MPYHDNQFLGELYAELFKREQPNNPFNSPFLGFTHDVQTTTTNNTIPFERIPKSNWLGSMPDKICKCGQNNECYHIYCWLCGDKL